MKDVYKMTYTMDEIYMLFAREIAVLTDEFGVLSKEIDLDTMKRIHKQLVTAYHPDLLSTKLELMVKQGGITSEEKERRLQIAHEKVSAINVAWLDYNHYLKPRSNYEYRYPNRHSSYSAKKTTDDSNISMFKKYCKILSFDPTAAVDYYNKLKGAGYKKTIEEWLQERVKNKDRFANAEDLIKSKKKDKNFFYALHYRDLINTYQLDLELLSINQPYVELFDMIPFDLWLNEIVQLSSSIDYENMDLILEYKYDHECHLFKDFIIKLQKYDQMAQVIGTKLFRLYNSYSHNSEGTKSFEQYMNKLYDDALNNLLIGLDGITKEDLMQKYVLFQNNLHYMGNFREFIELIRKCIPICDKINIDLSDAYVEYLSAMERGSKFNFYDWLSIYASMRLYNCQNLTELFEYIVMNQTANGNDLFGVITSLAGIPNVKEDEKRKK